MHRRRVAAVVAIAMLYAVLGVAPAAGARPSPPDRSDAGVTAAAPASAAATNEIRAARGGTPAGTGTANQPPPFIVCYLGVSAPRGPLPEGTVQASATLLCTYPVDFITVRVELFRNNTLVSRTEETVAFSLGWGVTTTANCANGSYKAIGEAIVAFPSGYFPPIGSGVAGTRTVDITCTPGAPPPGNQPPFGALDLVEALPPGYGFRIAGWAIDPDTTGPIQVVTTFEQPTYYMVGSATPTANLHRPDVGMAYPRFGPNHGFEVVGLFPLFPEDLWPLPGYHDICVWARNVPSGPGVKIGCRSMYITREHLGI